MEAIFEGLGKKKGASSPIDKRGTKGYINKEN
jgi:hypothetical protein